MRNLWRRAVVLLEASASTSSRSSGAACLLGGTREACMVEQQASRSLRAFSSEGSSTSANSSDIEPSPNDVRSLVLRTLVVDTLALAKRFEAAGLDRRPAELLAQYITEIIVINKARTDELFVDKRYLDKVVMEQEMRISTFKNELQKAQDVQSGNLGKELERQQTFLDKMRAEVRHEIDKLVSSQRLDMNLEKGRMRDDLQAMRDKTTDLEIKVDHDINDLKSNVEKSKNDTIKTVITILGTFSAIAFTVSRLMGTST